jgi:NAD-dependent dihydropyrimidine dehydrogenase PreA subunit
LAPKLALRIEKERDRQFEAGFHWCSKCKEFLSIHQFSRSKNRRYGLYDWCKNCHSETRKGNKQIQRTAKLRAASLISHYKKKLGGCCAKCGYAKSQYGLDFHHVTPGEKEFELSALISRGSAHEVIMAEIDKCILLCATCHREIESNIWDADFSKAHIGYTIKSGSIREFPEKGWVYTRERVLMSQKSLLSPPL